MSHTTTSVQGSAVFTESLGWRNDGRMISYSAVRGDFTDARSYGYSAFARRLTNESLTVGTSQYVTNSFGIDFGQSAKLGVLTSAAQSGAFASSWTAPSAGGLDGLRRLSLDQSTLVERPATGRAVGAGDLSGTLNGRPVPVQYDSANTNGTWRANMQLSPGPNTFIVTATHPSHLYTTAATNIYTNLISAADALTNNFDGDGNFTLRTKKDGSNNVITTQTLIWDANDRLVKVTERDSQNSGYNWTAVYDPLGRRLRTSQTLIVTNSAQPSPTVLDSWYDPEVEFLEVGVSVNGERHWRAYGPDLSGSYGGMQGAGGIEAILHDSALDWGYDGAIADQFGDVLAKIDFRDSSVTWFPTRVGAYGPVAGYPALPLERNEAGYYRLQPTLTWRGLRIDPTGFYCIGARYYDPEAGRFISADPMGFLGGSDVNGFCHGDPVNFFDPDGRLAARNTQAGSQNAPPPLELGVAPVMQQSIYSDFFFRNGTHSGPLSRSQAIIYDPEELLGNKYWRVTEPTGQSFSYVRDTRAGGPLADPGYGKTTWTAITTTEVEQQQRIQFLKAVPMILLTFDGAGPLLEGTGIRLLSADALAADGTVAFSRLAQAVGLTVSENAGGHLLARHIGLTEADLAARLSSQSGITAASTFATRAEAEAAVAGAFDANAVNVSAWTGSGANGRLVLNAPFSGGSVLQRGAAAAAQGTGVRVVLQGNGSGGYVILTGFPTP